MVVRVVGGFTQLGAGGVFLTDRGGLAAAVAKAKDIIMRKSVE